jgi:hypothetical protein
MAVCAVLLMAVCDHLGSMDATQRDAVELLRWIADDQNRRNKESEERQAASTLTRITTQAKPAAIDDEEFLGSLKRPTAKPLR